MTNQRNGSVDPSTMDILIGRAGVFRSSPPKCDYQIDTMVTWYHFTSLKCASPDGEWQLTVDGRFDLGGAALVLGGAGTAMLAEDAAGHYTGTWEAEFRIDLEGVPASIGGQEGHITGDATFADNTLTLIGTNATGDFWAQTPARSIGGAAGNPSKDFTLPVNNDAFCPAP